MGALFSSSSPTNVNMRHKRSVTSDDRDLKVFGLSEDLENWMRNLPPKLKATPIIHLALPGSHDSFTSGITSSSDLAPDAEDILKKIQWLGPIVKKFIVDWSRTQDSSVADQLKNGVRYFDLRLGTKNGTEDLFIVHGLYSNGVKQVFDEVRAFLEEHHQEIVILDCQHFYGFSQLDHENLIQIFNKTFGAKLLPYTNHMNYITLEYMTSQYRYQVIGIYRSDAARFGQPLLWPSDSFPTPWPNTMSKTKLFNALDIGIRNRGSNRAYISQCVLTPTVSYVVAHLFGSVRTKCAIRLEESRLKWLKNQQPGEKGLNIVIADYVDLSNWQFIREVIDLNGKLLSLNDDSPSDPVLHTIIHVNQA